MNWAQRGYWTALFRPTSLCPSCAHFNLSDAVANRMLLSRKDPRLPKDVLSSSLATSAQAVSGVIFRTGLLTTGRSVTGEAVVFISPTGDDGNRCSISWEERFALAVSCPFLNASSIL